MPASTSDDQEPGFNDVLSKDGLPGPQHRHPSPNVSREEVCGSLYPLSASQLPPILVRFRSPTISHSIHVRRKPTPRNAQLATFLSSASVINSSMSKGRPSIWPILEYLRTPARHEPENERAENKWGEGMGMMIAISTQSVTGP